MVEKCNYKGCSNEVELGKYYSGIPLCDEHYKTAEALDKKVGAMHRFSREMLIERLEALRKSVAIIDNDITEVAKEIIMVFWSGEMREKALAIIDVITDLEKYIVLLKEIAHCSGTIIDIFSQVIVKAERDGEARGRVSYLKSGRNKAQRIMNIINQLFKKEEA